MNSQLILKKETIFLFQNKVFFVKENENFTTKILFGL